MKIGINIDYYAEEIFHLESGAMVLLTRQNKNTLSRFISSALLCLFHLTPPNSDCGFRSWELVLHTR